LPAERDYYEVLGVGRDASEDEIKRAFRRLARQCHPDANPGDPVAEERFKELNEAHEVLRDPEKRAAYDRFGRAGVNGQPGGPFTGFDSIFDAFFGGLGRTARAARPGPERGADLEMVLEIDLAEAAAGLEREVELSRIESCPICGGSGLRPGARADRCPQCHGSGQVTSTQSTVFGRFVTTRTCDYCGGQGFIINDPCDECGGRGAVRRLRKLKVKVPPGVDSGTRLRLSGQGQGGVRGGPSGDLYVHIRVRAHPRLARRGNDLYSEETVSFVRAALGGRLRVQTLYGPEEIDVPAGTQPGDVLRLRGKGMPDPRRPGARGDHHLEIKVAVPRRLGKRQRELLIEFAKESGEEPAAAAEAGPSGNPRRPPARPRGKRKKTFVERVKDALTGEPDE